MSHRVSHRASKKRFRTVDAHRALQKLQTATLQSVSARRPLQQQQQQQQQQLHKVIFKLVAARCVIQKRNQLCLKIATARRPLTKTKIVCFEYFH